MDDFTLYRTIHGLNTFIYHITPCDENVMEQTE